MSKRRRNRVGRGPGSGSGKTAGRGTKGLYARSGSKHRPWFEGGQMPLQRRTPKRGFNSRRHIDFQLVKLGDLARKFPDGGSVSLADLKEAGLIKSVERPAKILAVGDIAGVAVTVEAHKVSAAAQEKIEAAGGSVVLIPLAEVTA